ncbi:MAG: hypothetical protein C5B44_00740 [Acidobacteria bacterium]|nr:MAG: hypothetical protein C5B44_00740 [Acidobacteriota bacterium]
MNPSLIGIRPHCPTRLFSILLLFVLSGLAQGQQAQCSLKLSELPAAPELVGFHLGMTKEQVKLKVPQVRFGKADDFGVSKTTINPFFDPRIDTSSFEGIRSISLDFLDDRLTSLWIGYDSSFKVPNVEEFTKRISQSLHLPNGWTPWRSRGQQMQCADFQLIVTMVADGPSFRMVDSKAEGVVAERREAKEEQDSASAETSEAAVEIVGDKRNGVYYTPGCHPNMEIPAADRLVFKSVDEANKAGLKPAKNCQ